LSEENDADHPPGEPGEDEREKRTRRVRPLFRFGRKSRQEEDTEEVSPPEEGPPPEGGAPPEDTPVDDPQGPVRPVRVVKFVPSEGDGPDAGEEEGADEEPFTVEEEVPFVEEGEAPFDVEEEPPFVEEGEAPFTVDDGEGAPFEMEPEVPATEEDAVEAPFVFEEQTTPVRVEPSPETPYENMERTRWDEPVHDTISTQEEAETGEDMEFRSEESPAHLESAPGAPVEDTAEPERTPEETKPHYHKYLKPDEDLVSRPQARGPATGFDRDMDADAGEIDFGIDLIDPSERMKRKKTPPKKPEGPIPKKGVGGHDFDAEVDSKGMGNEVGVDYNKRRKRRL
jgi:hypothetical protein